MNVLNFITLVSVWPLVMFGIPHLIKHEAKETRRLVVELAGLKTRGPLHTYEIHWDDAFCGTNVVDDGKVVYT